MTDYLLLAAALAVVVLGARWYFGRRFQQRPRQDCSHCPYAKQCAPEQQTAKQRAKI